MADEEAKDLRSMLAEAAAEVESVEPATILAREEKPAAAIPEPKTETPPPETGGRQRDANGRFLPKDGETQEEADTAGAVETKPASAEATEEGVQAKEPEVAASGAEPPAHWSQADKEMVAKLPAEFRGEVVERIKRIEAGFTPKLQKLAQVEKEYGGAMEVFAPYMDQIRQRGQTPSDTIRVWAQLEQSLLSARMATQSGRTDPMALSASANGAQIVARIIQSYLIDPGEVARHLSGEQQQNGTAQPQQNGYVADPALMQEVQAIKQNLAAREQYERETKTQSAQQQIEAFASEKNPDGSLKNPYFSELESVITELATFERSQGRSIDLPTLYKRAVRLDDSTYQRELSSQRQADEKRVAEERRAKAEAAKKASSSVTGAPSPGQTSQRAPSTRSLRADLESAAEEATPAR